MMPDNIHQQLQAIIDSPTEHDFYQAVYQFQQQLGQGREQGYKVGFDAIPQQELLRFKSDQHLGFPGQAISDVQPIKYNQDDKLAADMHVSFMGLTGPSGVLPSHYTELLLERLRLKDTGMRDFYDLFNHRIISLFYRAWEKYRFSVNYQSSTACKPDSFTHVLSLLSGKKSINRYYAGFNHTKTPSAESLRRMLNDFTGCQVEVCSFQGRWQHLSQTEQTRMASRSMPEGQYARLGVDASIGSRVWDINSSVSINIKPKEGATVTQFMPGAASYEALKDLVSGYLGQSVKYKIFLEIKQKDAPTAQLSKSAIGLGLGCGLMSRALHGQQTKSLMI
ncbi:type VI secretion system baseplate subunit TssG [Shewanella ulleungensis]|jgi:type VI secretion system protein ImpH|uniref:Type VI secretion protein n=1 Tax=Shewanella ulleungensis TaxID=2282699 RepID=A0ABQ2QBN5_9GAMM|nr:type VI secretion system baseplate subunit TssG [Shewanella ulleungensis]MCL1149164.1 type VI secretion system baseplate subunit TssG [Shewanella ulleungensis]GGP73148.1 type VI secretion protein [Shewanella ulleungensis]